MSKGPGRIERAIRELFDAHPDLAFVTDELAEHCYPDARPIEHKHQVAALRAAWKVIEHDPDWRVWVIEGQGRGLVFYNRGNLQSYALGSMIADSGFVYHSEKRARRRWWARKPETRNDLLARLQPGSVNDHFLELFQPGGSWARRVESHCARRSGDVELAERLDDEQEYERARACASIGMNPSAVGIDMERVKRCERAMACASSGMNPSAIGIDMERVSVALPNSLSAEQHLSQPPIHPLAELADRVRAIMVQNDPDALRAGLAEIADTLDQLGRREAPILDEAAD